MIDRIRRRVARAVAYLRVRSGHAQRICAPGKWVVWREGDLVRVEIKGKAEAR